MPIKATAEKLEENKVKLSVEVPAEDVSLAIDKAFKKISQKVSIPGFRKGKVPRSVMESRFGKEPAIEEALNDMVPQWYLKAVDMTGIKPIDRPQVDFGEYDADKVESEPMKFEATVEVKPEVELGNYIGLKAEKEPVEVTDDDIQNNLNLLLERFAKLELVENKKVKEHNFVLIDFKGYLNDEVASQASDYLLEVGAGSMLEDFEKELIGMKENQAKNFTITFPNDYQRLDFAGKEISFEVTLKEIKKKVLPMLNDEFAKEISDFDSLDDLKEEIRKDLSSLREEQSDSAFKRDTLKMVSDNSEVKLPEILINIRAEELFRDFAQTIQMRGATVDQVLERTGKTREEMLDDFKVEAAVQVKNELVLDSIVTKEKMDLSEEELMDELKQGAERFGGTPEQLRDQIRDRGTEELFKETVLREKALELIVEKASPVLKKKDEKVKDKKPKAGKRDNKPKKEEEKA